MNAKYILLSFLALSACAPQYQTEKLHSTQERKITAGLVDSEIHSGMSQSQVAAILGSPNLATKDSDGIATWVYDKVAQETSYGNSSRGIGVGAGAAGEPGSVGLLGLGGLSLNDSKGGSASTQRTLTVVIRFTPRGEVSSTSYHQSSF